MLKIAVAIPATALSLTAFFVWPTPYQYEHVKKQYGTRTFEQIYRINRFSGESQLVVDTTPPPPPQASSGTTVDYESLYRSELQWRKNSQSQATSEAPPKSNAVEVPDTRRRANPGPPIDHLFVPQIRFLRACEQLHVGMYSSEVAAMIDAPASETQLTVIHHGQPVPGFDRQRPDTGLCILERYFPDGRGGFKLHILYGDDGVVEWKSFD